MTLRYGQRERVGEYTANWFNKPTSVQVEYLVIAGGGGGGSGSGTSYNGGGGGAGGYRSSVSGEGSGRNSSAEATITLTPNTGGSQGLAEIGRAHV